MIDTVSGEVLMRRTRTQTVPPTLIEQRRRIRTSLARTLAGIPPRFDLAVIESLPTRSLDGSHNQRAGLYWLLVDQLLARGPVVSMSPKTRAKYATGNGNADKAVVKAAVRSRFPGLVIPDDNVADAVAMAAAAARRLGAPVDGALSVKQEQAHAAVAWPQTEGESA